MDELDDFQPSVWSYVYIYMNIFIYICVLLQEHLHFVTEICQDEVFILDHEGPVVSPGASTGMPDLVVEPSAGYVNNNEVNNRF